MPYTFRPSDECRSSLTADQLQRCFRPDTKNDTAFVRGMMMRAVEETCRKNGFDRVTVEELERIRARMPTPKMFG